MRTRVVPAPRLRLHRETVRLLGSLELSLVAGGGRTSMWTRGCSGIPTACSTMDDSACGCYTALCPP